MTCWKEREKGVKGGGLVGDYEACSVVVYSRVV